jgi:pimeloyl-ACP methyl ester carboxylesterase
MTHPILVLTEGPLAVTYTLFEAPHPVSDRAVALHHGICHTRVPFLPLIEQLNGYGIHAVMIEQQSENAGFFRNGIGLDQYRGGMTAAVRRIENVDGWPIGSYVLHSMGALIGEEMQQANENLLRPTVFLAPIPMAGAFPITLRIMRRRPRSYLKTVLALDIQSLMHTPEQVRELFFDARTPADIVEDTTAQLKHAPFWAYCQLVLRWLVRPRINDDQRPKMLLYSETDEIFRPEEYKKTISHYSRLEVHAFDGGHDFFIEYAEPAAKLIADFHLQHNPQDAASIRLRPDEATRVGPAA